MKSNIKKYISKSIVILSAVFLLSAIIAPIGVNAATGLSSNDSKENDGHLIVSMVYDDSESMDGEREKYFVHVRFSVREDIKRNDGGDKKYHGAYRYTLCGFC